ncbi:MAG: hypothetical protein GFH27_549301n77 [Chloroflexi bacterium AL-W]|nr:hypothetical protein [Chloroflexi bacterium AL-N1]NOK68270.1 hypothetical protein [Chloroflexi bacterium AL-N10]NOK73916.1 hypothetical protein [Chloroflexi bacterium AL-N5]NOK82884.1 hypothetical protein [Chloroflexi bacterium AL-W]NOK90406.1 hypothetical protein [Chloroflexi bacterium AL-N15]
MHRSQLQGTYEEIGQQQGQVIRQIGLAAPLSLYTPQQYAFARMCQEQLGIVASELLTAMNSLIDASEMDADAMATMMLMAPFADGHTNL